MTVTAFRTPTWGRGKAFMRVRPTIAFRASLRVPLHLMHTRRRERRGWEAMATITSELGGVGPSFLARVRIGQGSDWVERRSKRLALGCFINRFVKQRLSS